MYSETNDRTAAEVVAELAHGPRASTTMVRNIVTYHTLSETTLARMRQLLQEWGAPADVLWASPECRMPMAYNHAPQDRIRVRPSDSHFGIRQAALDAAMRTAALDEERWINQYRYRMYAPHWWPRRLHEQCGFPTWVGASAVEALAAAVEQ